MNKEIAFFQLLDESGIAWHTVEHEAAFTAKGLACRDLTPYEFPVKNIVVEDKNKQIYLVTMHLLTPPLDLKELAKSLGANGRFSFASPQTLADVLGVLPGSVTPFAVCNDRERKVKVVLDERLQTSKTISAHPLINTMTTTIAVEDLLRLFAQTGHEPRWCDLPLKPEAP